MNWRESVALAEIWYRQIITDDGTARLAAAIGAALLVALTLSAVWLLKRRRRRLGLSQSTVH
ncbi:MAG: hypothetical protein R3D67_00995 [Hyphomicrobiaceae bacterium]